MIPRKGAFFIPTPVDGSADKPPIHKAKRRTIAGFIRKYGAFLTVSAVLTHSTMPGIARAELAVRSTTIGIAPTIQTAIQTVEEPAPEPSKTYKVWVTAYTSTPEETDNTPFETASGGKVRDGIVAANFLPFGAKIKIPSEFGDKIFTVEDRMHRRKKNFVDIWMPTKKNAFRFGIRYAEIVVVENPREHNSIAIAAE